MNLKNAKSIIFDSFLFKDIDNETKEKLFESCDVEIKEFKKGDCVYESESDMSSVGFVLVGGIKIYGGSGEKKVLLNEKRKGGIFGAALMFSDDPRPYTKILTNGSTSVAFISEKDFTDIVLSDKRISRNYINFLTEKIRFLNKKIFDFTLSGNDSKVSQYLCEQSDEYGFVSDFNCQKTANKLNMSRASLYRILNSLENEGIIEKGTGYVKIINKEKLK